MAAMRFEALVRALAAHASRRAMLASLAGGLLTALPLALGDETARAMRKQRHAKQQHRRAHDRAEAERHKKKKKKKKQSPPPPPPPPASPPPPPPPPPPTRQIVTRSFSNTAAITINDNAAASLYPSEIVVSGFANGVITDVNVTITGLNHTFPADIDILLTATQITGRNALLLSDIGGSTDAVGVNLVLDDNAPTPLGAAVVSGTFQPSISSPGDAFPAPAPPPIGNPLLLTFNGQNPNGTWQLFIVDDAGGDTGNITGGWALEITAEVDV